MSIPSRFAGRVLRFKRLVRLFIAALIALGWALLLTLLAELILSRSAATSQPGNGLFYVNVIIGMAIYLAGWKLIVGPVGKPPPPRTAAGWYVLLGILAVILAIILLIAAFVITAAPL